jgi:hypothetical protein
MVSEPLIVIVFLGTNAADVRRSVKASTKKPRSFIKIHIMNRSKKTQHFAANCAKLQPYSLIHYVIIWQHSFKPILFMRNDRWEKV